MPYIRTVDREQLMMCSLDSFVAPESIARVIDAFVEGLEPQKIGIAKRKAAIEGRPSYPWRCMIKLYLYGSRKKIRSSRNLAEACRLNVEVKWLMEGLEPDFRTISDFRKENIDCMKKIFHEFNRRISKFLEKGFVSVDGSKFQAVNSKDNNFTANKLDDRIRWLNQHTDEYLRQLAELDEKEDQEEPSGQLTREELEKRLKEAHNRLEYYQRYRAYMEENGLSQLSLTDPDARLMKSKNGFQVAYNVQTAVDSETHLIEDYIVTNQITDHGLLGATVCAIKEAAAGAVVEAVADKGYHEVNDMADCLEKGIIPNVILPSGQDTYELEIRYEEAGEEPDTEAGAEGIKRSLRSGNIPKEYEGIIEKAAIVEKKEFVKEAGIEPAGALYDNGEEMKKHAQEGYFVRDRKRNLVYCPAGEILRQKCVKRNGTIRYANKSACKHCKKRNGCYKGKNEGKEIDFSKDTREKPCQDWLKSDGKDAEKEKQVKTGHYELKKVVRITFRPDRKKMSQRKNLSEHPFGTIKRWMDAGYYLLRGKQKVAGETALMCLGYNLERAKNLLGFARLMEAMT